MDPRERVLVTYFILIGEGLNYPTVADLGFAGVFLFLITGFQEGLPRNRLPGWVAAPVAPLIVTGLWLVAVLGADAKTLTTLVIFVLSAALLTSALLRSAERHPVLLAATVVFVLAHLCNSLNSTPPIRRGWSKRPGRWPQSRSRSTRSRS